MGLEERVARYAALADPIRLRIVDLLTLGDVAPVELQRELGVTSNLLAHHVSVLERAGLVTRSRSEADRRRTYLHLVPGGFDDLLPTPTLAARRVVFVCTGNSARSQLAAALWERSSTVPATSAGTHPAERVDPGAIAAAERHGLALHGRAPRALSDVVSADDVIVTVCDSAHEELGGNGHVHWSVPDPVPAGTPTAFDDAYDDLAARISALATQVTAP
ncbi:transcriptional regulator, MarR family [Xylanimonas cellulosilytica DSM 15894]|uniref:Transcriptional regulator, MarR family n=1 Tax=Xylanimonas cellulosilytica (strain DSM 15894 / JCM 12276 / CECT 5975 / KCTC 9989 / LMG 20990 / NBRC 107835 / XIL07) TaxID=446471 RepID=D1BRS8_XYLCX|nr:helix-turn-helix domain-containing protein [Xylanimonas cellulosilytica]ACZ32344.1 transcriptional regulator, MarR family [Xylanimonas cellulosilytica DSM 15894]